MQRKSSGAKILLLSAILLTAIAQPIMAQSQNITGANIRDKVLNTAKHPEISFRSTLIAGDATAATVTGDLTIAGSTRPVQLRLTAHPDADRVTGAASIVQTNHGIKPYSAMFGTLKVKDLAPPDEG